MHLSARQFFYFQIFIRAIHTYCILVFYTRFCTWRVISIRQPAYGQHTFFLGGGGGRGEGGEGGEGEAACPATEKSEQITRAEPFQLFILLRFYIFISEKTASAKFFLNAFRTINISCNVQKYNTVVYTILQYLQMHYKSITHYDRRIKMLFSFAESFVQITQ